METFTQPKITGIASKFHRKALCWVIRHGLVAEVARGPIVWRAI